MEYDSRRGWLEYDSARAWLEYDSRRAALNASLAELSWETNSLNVTLAEQPQSATLVQGESNEKRLAQGPKPIF